MSKLKILWICHFTNAEVQTKLPLWRKQDESAPWVPNVIKGLQGRDDIELHVISPHDYLRRQTSFSQNNIHYYFISYGVPIFNRHWPGIYPYDVYADFAAFRGKVKKLVAKIKPDLINLIGAENSYYSSSILDFKGKYPILITIQGFISQMKDVIELTPKQNKMIEIEEQILKDFKFYCGEQDSSTYIFSFNPNHQFFRLYFPVNEDLVYATHEQDKRYDCIFYGRITREKGIEAFIKVVAELKAKKPDITACVIGHGDTTPYKTLANDLKCLQHIDFVGFLETQKELFEKVKSSRVFLVPTYFDRLPSSIREAMYLKVLIVAYATGGIPYINELDENIYLVDKGDYKEMARKAILLLDNDYLLKSLSGKAFQYAATEFSLQANVARLLSAYKYILNNHLKK